MGIKDIKSQAATVIMTAAGAASYANTSAEAADKGPRSPRVVEAPLPLEPLCPEGTVEVGSLKDGVQCMTLDNGTEIEFRTGYKYKQFNQHEGHGAYVGVRAKEQIGSHAGVPVNGYVGLEVDVTGGDSTTRYQDSGHAAPYNVLQSTNTMDTTKSARVEAGVEVPLFDGVSGNLGVHGEILHAPEFGQSCYSGTSLCGAKATYFDDPTLGGGVHAGITAKIGEINGNDVRFQMQGGYTKRQDDRSGAEGSIGLSFGF